MGRFESVLLFLGVLGLAGVITGGAVKCTQERQETLRTCLQSPGRSASDCAVMQRLNHMGN